MENLLAKRKFLFRKGILSILIFAFSINFFLTSNSQATSGVPTILSYQGRLTNSSGDLLGGSGTAYYFKFSLWDTATVSSGTRLWPLSAPSSVSSTVRQGVFNVDIGDTTGGFPTALDYNFNTNNAIYLQVEVSSDNSSFETLTPRQHITSSAFAQLAAAVSSTNRPSSFGTTTPIGNSTVTIEASSTNATPLLIRAASGQTSDLFTIQNNAANNLLTVNSLGSVGIGTSTPGQLFSVAGNMLGNGIISLTGSGTSTFTGGINTNALNITSTSASSTFAGGIIAGGGLRFSTYNCSNFANGGLLTTDSSGLVKCADDDIGAGSVSVNSGTTNRLAYYSAATTLDSINFLSLDTGNSFLGVGTSTPGTALALVGSAVITGNATIYGTSTIFAVISTSTASSTFSGGLSSVGLRSSNGLSLTAGLFTNTSAGTSTRLNGMEATVINVTSSSATSTFNNGIQLSGGCFKDTTGLCLSNGALGIINSGTINRLAYYSGATTHDSANFLSVDTGNSFFGIGTSTPGTAFSLVGAAVFSGNTTIYGTSTLLSLNATSTASSTFIGGIFTGGLSTNNGLSLTGGALINTSSGTTTKVQSAEFAGGIVATNGITLTTGGGISNLVAGTSTKLQSVEASGLLLTNGLTLSTGGSILNSITGTSTQLNGVSATVLNITSATASSTFANGIQLSGGCFKDTTGSCVSGAINSGTINRLAYYSGSTTHDSVNFLVADISNQRFGIASSTPSAHFSLGGNAYLDSNLITISSSSAAFLTINYQSRSTTTIPNGVYNGFTIATSTSGTNPLLSIDTTSGGRIGIGTSSVFARFTIAGSGSSQGNAFGISNIASSTLFLVQDSGNVGIGTTTPGSLLSVQGVGNFTSATSTFYSGLLGYNTIQSSALIATSTLLVGGTTGTSMIVTNAGNVGIGTVSPVEKLHVVGNIKLEGANQGITMNTADGADSSWLGLSGGGAYNDSTRGAYLDLFGNDISPLGLGGDAILAAGKATSGNGAIYFQTDTGAGAVNQMVILNNGNVGIGTTSPGSVFSIQGVGNFSNTGTSTIYDGLKVSSLAATSGVTILGGNLLVSSSNTATSAVITGYIDVQGSTATSTFGNIQAPSIHVTNGISFAKGITENVQTGGVTLCVLTKNTYTVFLSSSATTCTTSSARYKHDIQNLSTGLSAVLRMRPVSFVYNEGNQATNVGFIAEEMNEIDPRVIIYDSEGKPNGIEYPYLTAILAKAIKEMNNVIDMSYAPTSTPSLIIDASGNIGVGTTTPEWLSGLISTSTPDADINIANTFITNTLNSVKFIADSIVSRVSVIKEAFVHTFTIAPWGKIKIPSGQNQIAGESVYPAHSSSIFVPNTSVASTSNIVIMPKVAVQSPFVVTEIRENIGFVVRTATPPNQDIPFKWFSVETYQVGLPFSSPIIESAANPESTPIPSSAPTPQPSPLLSDAPLPSQSAAPSSTPESSPTNTPESSPSESPIPEISEHLPLLDAPSAPPQEEQPASEPSHGTSL